VARFLSEAMKTLPKLDWLRKGSPLPSGTATASLASARERVLAGERVADYVDVRDWLGGAKRAPVTEASVGLGQYGKVLTVLVSTSIGPADEPDEDEKEEDLVERWTPRFRR
jgi:hypothetical protein